jgi:hypothetical protein
MPLEDDLQPPAKLSLHHLGHEEDKYEYSELRAGV